MSNDRTLVAGSSSGALAALQTDSADEGRSSNKRVLVIDSSPVQIRTSAVNVSNGNSQVKGDRDEEDIYANNRKVFARSTPRLELDQTSTMTSRHFLPAASSSLNPSAPSTLQIDLHSRKRLRLDDPIDSQPASATHSALTSPVDSRSSSIEVMTSPATVKEDSQQNRQNDLRKDLSQLGIASIPSSSAGSRRNSPPRPKGPGLVRGRPKPPAPSPSNASPVEPPLYPEDDEFNKFFYGTLKDFNYAQELAHRAWVANSGLAEPTIFQLVQDKKAAEDALQKNLSLSSVPATDRLSHHLASSPHSVQYQSHQKHQQQSLQRGLPASNAASTLPSNSRPYVYKASAVVSTAGLSHSRGSSSSSASIPAPRLVSVRPIPAASTPILAPKQKKKRVVLSGSEAEEYSDGSGSDFDGPSAAELARADQKALTFFNTCSREEMVELASCSMTQATLVMKLRDFTSVDDFRSRTRKQKGVGNAMMENYQEVMEGLNQVDEVLTECEEIGAKLARIMQIWAGGNEATSSEVGLNLVDNELVGKAAATSTNPEVRQAFEGFLLEQPSTMSANVKLKDYQMLGLNWLNLLYNRGTSCILADEMGLGKTAQVIALMAHLKSIGKPGPHLVIVPSSTLENWLREFSVFAPDLYVASYYGSQADRHAQRMDLRRAEGLDVVVTTYNIATSTVEDAKFVKKQMKFKICVFDEGHQLKNSESKKYKDLMGIKAEWRLLLTGTPLQNNLQELISLLSFILPDTFFDARHSLKAIFKIGPGGSANLLSRQRIDRAKKMMTPFVLRRKKAQVLKDLPKKIERIEWCDMTLLQREVHNEAMMRSKKALMDANVDLDAMNGVDDNEDAPVKKKTGAKSTLKTGDSGSNVLMDLRKASNHPMLFRRLYPDKVLRLMAKDCLKEDEFLDRDVELIFEDMQVMTDFELSRLCSGYKHLKKHCLMQNEWMSSGKVEALQRLLPEMKARGDRILLFSQFTQVLEILEVVLDTMKIKYLKLTGQTNVADRQGLVDDFNEDPEITVFLLSTRAGGLGLNLTSANVVIMHDQDFNPHSDKQAEDRAYRIGQLRDVTVIKLICKDSVEEMMRTLATTKLLLDSEVSGQSAEAAVDDDGDAASTEKKLKSSILTSMKLKFTTEAAQSGRSSLSPVKEDKM